MDQTFSPVPAHEENQYLDLVREIIEKGDPRSDRTGTGTLSVFGRQMRFSLENDVVPIIGTKRTACKTVLKELLWFVSGDTNAKTLQDQGVRIWDGNGSREYLDSIGKHDRPVGDLGPIYGFQWRHFGAEYKTCHDDYTGQGVDQLAQLVDDIKTNPYSRRHLLTAWNPAALSDMALPPCHFVAQFYVSSKKELSCHLNQRSCDMGLGVPFNIFSYAALTRMMAQVTGTTAKELVYSLGDAHVYNDHIEPLKEQLKRTPPPFPTMTIDPTITCIDDFRIDSFTINNYKPGKSIKMNMSV